MAGSVRLSVGCEELGDNVAFAIELGMQHREQVKEYELLHVKIACTHRLTVWL